MFQDYENILKMFEIEIYFTEEIRDLLKAYFYAQETKYNNDIYALNILKNINTKAEVNYDFLIIKFNNIIKLILHRYYFNFYFILLNNHYKFIVEEKRIYNMIKNNKEFHKINKHMSLLKKVIVKCITKNIFVYYSNVEYFLKILFFYYDFKKFKELNDILSTKFLVKISYYFSFPLYYLINKEAAYYYFNNNTYAAIVLYNFSSLIGSRRGNFRLHNILINNNDLMSNSQLKHIFYQNLNNINKISNTNLYNILGVYNYKKKKISKSLNYFKKSYQYNKDNKSLYYLLKLSINNSTLFNKYYNYYKKKLNYNNYKLPDFILWSALNVKYRIKNLINYLLFFRYN